jgi:CBS domain-containing protein
LIGFTLKDDLNSQPKDISRLIQTNQPVQRNQYLKDILKEFRDDFRSLPVIDNQGRFKGDITKSDIIEAIA